MKFVHLSDLHLGKRVHNFSMLEDQRYILAQILQKIDQETPDGVIIAGDVYDQPSPPAAAVTLLDEFLVHLAERHLQVFVISGNHDSAERIAFGGRLMKPSGVHMAQTYCGTVPPVVLRDKYGLVNVYLLPFVKPAHVRSAFPERQVDSYTDALRIAIEAMHVDDKARNVLVTHQFVTGATRCDSEERSVGGTDNVDGGVFDSFDYVALGHIHGPQKVGRQTMRYCGSPLKYSFSEARHQKSVTVVEMGEKGNIQIHTLPLVPMREMVELRGTYEELTLREFYEGTSYQEDYVHITLTNEEDVPDAMSRLRTVYRNLMTVSYDNHRTRAGQWIGETQQTEEKMPLELLEEFYEKQNGQPMSEQQKGYAAQLIEDIWEGQA